MLMELLISFAIALPIAAVLLFCIFEGVSWSVYGKLLSDAELRVFLAKHLPKYELNSIAPHIMMADRMALEERLPFVAIHSFTPLSKWYFSEWGRVPRWSKASKMLDRRHANLKMLGTRSTLIPEKLLADE